MLRNLKRYEGRVMPSDQFNAVQSGGRKSSGREEVAALRMMRRDERLALLMQSLDATCGRLAPRRRLVSECPVAKPGGKR